MASDLGPIPREGYGTLSKEHIDHDMKASQGSNSDLGYHDETAITWTEAEEKKLVRKIDSIVMPLLILGFFALQFDRGNM